MLTLSLKKLGVAGAMALSGLVASGPVLADTIQCANPVLSGQNRAYQTSGAQDCVWGEGNIGSGGGNDEFLSGGSTNDAMYGDLGPTFGLTGWGVVGQSGYSNGFGSVTGLTLSNVDGDSFDWLLTDSTYAKYALGLKDGGSPKYGVFLLSSTSGLAEILSSGGSWSHVVLYGTSDGGGDINETPEPGILALVAIALLGIGAARRSRKA